MRNNPSLERCSVCDHFNYEDDIRRFVTSRRTGEPVCETCLIEIKDTLLEFTGNSVLYVEVPSAAGKDPSYEDIADIENALPEPTSWVLEAILDE